MAQLTMLGGLSGSEKVAPIAHGDIIVRHDMVRCVVTHADSDAYGRGVYACVRLDTGAECMILDREVAYRSK